MRRHFEGRARSLRGWILASVMRAVTLTLIVPCTAMAQTGGPYNLSWNVIAGGGATFLTGGTFRLGGTAGQPVVDSSAGAPYAVSSGFSFSGQIATGVALLATLAQPDSAGLPRVFAFRVYPAGRNPGGPPVSIGFDLPETQAVRLTVFSPEGRRLRVLMEGPATVGSHRVVWDGSDEGGRALASGVYFVLLESSTGISRHKLVLMR